MVGAAESFALHSANSVRQVARESTLMMMSPTANSQHPTSLVYLFLQVRRSTLHSCGVVVQRTKVHFNPWNTRHAAVSCAEQVCNLGP
jgi:hypothetical protein